MNTARLQICTNTLAYSRIQSRKVTLVNSIYVFYVFIHSLVRSFHSLIHLCTKQPTKRQTGISSN